VSNSAEPKQRCSVRVFSGARHDINGHLCANTGKYEVEGKLYCGLHRPDKVAERKAKKAADEQAARDAVEKSRVELNALGEKLGVQFYMDRGRYGRFDDPFDRIVIKRDALEELVALHARVASVIGLIGDGGMRDAEEQDIIDTVTEKWSAS
jgi:hypothetical protein